MSSVFSVFKFCIAVYTVLLVMMYLFQRKFIYFPSKTRPSLGRFSNIYKEWQSQTMDQLSLTHWYSKNNKPCVVVLHGNAGGIKDRVSKFQFLIDDGYSVLLISYRGYDGNLGNPTELNLISDSALALKQFLKTENFSAKDIVLFGESLGSGVVVALATQYAVKGVIFDGAYSSIAEVGQGAYPWIPVQWMLKDQWRSITRIKKVISPTLFIHSKKDAVVPFSLGQKLFQSANQPKKYIWLEHTGHNDNLDSHSVQKNIIDFIQSL